MRKQIDFDVRVFKLTPMGTEAGTTTHEAMRKFIQLEYLENGWEVINTFMATPEPNTVPLTVVLARYEDVDSVSTESAGKKK